MAVEKLMDFDDGDVDVVIIPVWWHRWLQKVFPLFNQRLKIYCFNKVGKHYEKGIKQIKGDGKVRVYLSPNERILKWRL